MSAQKGIEKLRSFAHDPDVQLWFTEEIRKVVREFEQGAGDLASMQEQRITLKLLFKLGRTIGLKT